MSKILQLSGFQTSLPLFPVEHYIETALESFKASELGRFRESLPLEALANELDLRDNPKGPNCFFSPQGKLALMFLKHHANVSDRQLIEHLNVNVFYQIFCGVLIPIDKPLRNFKIVSQIRCEIAPKLNIEKAQLKLAEYWKTWMSSINCMTVDATCYESYVRYPTDVKLLWESVNFLHKAMKIFCKINRIKLPRTQFSAARKKYPVFSKMRRKPKGKRIQMTRRLLRLLERLLSEMHQLIPLESDWSLNFRKRFSTIEKVFEQQRAWFHEDRKPVNRIISIDKPYLRPIVRGKEKKPVEFGAKVNKIQIDGISFIEHLSFDAFNEGIRFKSSVFLAQKLMKKRVIIAGADGIYATNANRKFATKNSIRTDFKRKGRASLKHENHRKNISRQITKERASRLEGSFGTEKEHYSLRNVKARTKENEILWIFLGIHTMNAKNIARRIHQKRQAAA